MNDDEFGSAKLLKFKYRRGDQIIHSFWKIGSFFFNLQKFQEPDKKKSSESYRTHGNLMKEEEFGSLKVLKSKYRSGDEIRNSAGQKFLGSSQEIKPRRFKQFSYSAKLISHPSLEIGSPLEPEGISENWRKVSTLNHVKYII